MVSLYTPLTLKEQDVLHNLQEGQDFYIEIEGWGFCSNPKLTVGDKRLQFKFPIIFTAPDFIMPVRHFDLVLKLRDGTVCYKSRESTVFNNHPLPVQTGLHIDMIWDISIGSLSEDLMRKLTKAPKVTKTLKEIMAP
jgi:hypothetical protein